jgi:UDP-2,3-diacylglucosamine pyrophosphatase LpxH
VRSPRTYEISARAAGFALLVHPDIYSAYAHVQAKAGARRRGVPPDEAAAAMLLDRGFDTVIFGHTHNPCDVDLAEGHYVNSGNWLRGSSYVEIDQGKVELKKWESWRT